MNRSGRFAALVAILSCAVVIGCGGSDDGANETVSAYPSPGTQVASPETTISFVGIDPDDPGEITVSGSESGEHTGTFEAFEAEEGAAFVPDRPFVPEETVTVTSDHEIAGVDGGQFEFRTATFRTDAAPPPRQLPKEGKLEIESESFRSRPDLTPPVVTIDTPGDERAAEGEIFMAPKVDGPMIVDQTGELIYYRPDIETADFRTQTYKGEPVLTWWEGPFNAGGYTEGTFVIAGQDYEEIKRVRMGNGYKGDLHEFKLTDRGTAYVPAYRTVLTDLSEYGGPRRGAVLDSVAQEIDLETGHVLWEWHSMGNVALDETMIQFPESPTEAFDYFHINSINEDDDGNILISGRNTFNVVKADKQTGETIWQLGGKESDFEMGEGTDFSWQHDAIRMEDGTLTLYDNAANYFGEPTYEYSRGLVLELDEENMTAELAQDPYIEPDRILAPSQGNMQTLPNGNRLVGWGSEPYFTEYTNEGDVVMDASFRSRNSSYRTYKMPWQGAPSDPPAVASEAAGNGQVDVWVSWNGATDVEEWRLLAGPTANDLTEVTTVPRDGFETEISGQTDGEFIAVEGLDADGEVLGTSDAAPVGELSR